MEKYFIELILTPEEGEQDIIVVQPTPKEFSSKRKFLSILPVYNVDIKTLVKISCSIKEFPEGVDTEPEWYAKCNGKIWSDDLNGKPISAQTRDDVTMSMEFAVKALAKQQESVTVELHTPDGGSTKINTIYVTKQYLHDTFNGDVYNAIEWIQSVQQRKPALPHKPILRKDCTSLEASKFAEDLRVWEESSKDIETLKKQVVEYNTKLDSMLVDYYREVAGCKAIPDQYKDKVYAKAWLDGHAYGHSEVYHKLCSLVEIFE